MLAPAASPSNARRAVAMAVMAVLIVPLVGLRVPLGVAQGPALNNTVNPRHCFDAPRAPAHQHKGARGSSDAQQRTTIMHRTRLVLIAALVGLRAPLGATQRPCAGAAQHQPTHLLRPRRRSLRTPRGSMSSLVKYTQQKCCCVPRWCSGRRWFGLPCPRFAALARFAGWVPVVAGIQACAHCADGYPSGHVASS